MSAGDYRPFRPENAQSRSLETGVEFAKARHWRAFLRVSAALSLSARLPGYSNPVMVIWKLRVPGARFDVSLLSETIREDARNRAK
jgi:hypothetical protein